VELLDRSFAELSAHDLHEIVRLRIDVFVVEQACAYAELDGRDEEPSARHVTLVDDGRLLAYLRVLDDGDARRIGRVVTAAGARSRGLAARLVDHVLASTPGPWVLHAQSHLEDWYGARGFVVDGPAFDEDGIPHVPMRRG
jgi:ElaA protein